MDNRIYQGLDVILVPEMDKRTIIISAGVVGGRRRIVVLRVVDRVVRHGLSPERYSGKFFGVSTLLRIVTNRRSLVSEVTQVKRQVITGSNVEAELRRSEPEANRFRPAVRLEEAESLTIWDE